MQQDDHKPTPDLLRAETFEPLAGRTVRFGETNVDLVLDRVECAHAAAPAHLARAPFVVIFSGPKRETFLPEGLYSCNFGDGVTFDLHVAPIHTTAAGRQDYQAAFN